MKKDPGTGKPLFGQTPPSELFDKSDTRRLLLMSALLVALLAVFVVAQLQKRGADEGLDQRQELAIDEPAADLLEEVVVPTFDPERLRGKVSDSRQTDRVLRESAGIEELSTYVRGFGDTHFAALEVRELDAERLAELLADPAEQRAKPYRVRGTVLDFEERADREQVDGHLRLEGGEPVFFTVQRVPEHLLVGDFVRIDGLFFKIFRDEVAPGEWAEGPLVVGHRAVRSHPTLPPFDPDALQELLARVEDDGTGGMTRLTGDADLARWELMRYVQRPESEELDWENAPELDAAHMARLIRAGSEHRGRPMRIPISRMQYMRTQSAGENPLRLERTSNGWIGNSTWTGGPGVIQFIMPAQEQDLQRGAYTVARGFFLKNLAYEDRSGTLRTAPYLVLQTLEPFELPEDTLVQSLAWFMVGLTLFVAALFFVLLLRDRKNSLQFQAELARRRRARRERSGSSAPPSESAP